jgi:superfamily I DNA and/or RNA helicase
VDGEAEWGGSGRSWRNRPEADAVALRVRELLEHLPPQATIGVVTPYRAQSDEIEARLRDSHDRVHVGTAYKFQGGERDVVVLSLVAARNERPHVFDWADQQPELWNVATPGHARS